MPGELTRVNKYALHRRTPLSGNAIGLGANGDDTAFDSAHRRRTATPHRRHRVPAHATALAAARLRGPHRTLSVHCAATTKRRDFCMSTGNLAFTKPASVALVVASRRRRAHCRATASRSCSVASLAYRSTMHSMAVLAMTLPLAFRASDRVPETGLPRCGCDARPRGTERRRVQEAPARRCQSGALGAAWRSRADPPWRSNADPSPGESGRPAAAGRRANVKAPHPLNACDAAGDTAPA